MDEFFFAVTLFAAIGCGLLGGIFFAFSNFVMQALARLPPANGMAAMQAINVTVLNGLFLTLFFGTAAACLVLLVHSVWYWNLSIAAGSLLYLVGNFVVTVGFNVPLNNALARVAPSDAERAWRDYLVRWTRWNHVRALTASAAAVMLVLALGQLKT